MHENSNSIAKSNSNNQIVQSKRYGKNIKSIEKYKIYIFGLKLKHS